MTSAPDRQASQARFWQRIQGKLVLLLLVLLLPLLLLQAHVLYDRFQGRRATELSANLELARALAKSFETFVQDVLRQELSIGLALTSSHSPSDEDVQRILVESQAGQAAVAALAWVEPDGTLVAASDPAFVGVNISDRKHFQDILAGRDWTVSDLVISRAKREPVFAVVRAIRDTRGELLGMVLASIAPDRLDSVLGIKRSKGGGVSLVDSKGKLVYRYPHLNPSWEERDWLRSVPQIKKALDGEEITWIGRPAQSNEPRIMAGVPISSIGWSAGAGRAEDIALEPAVSELRLTGILFLLVTLGAFGLALALSRFISNPVKQLRNHVLALGRTETRESAALSGPAELKDLADSFNTMAEELRSREMSLHEQREWLRVTLSSIGDAVIATDTAGRITFLNPVAACLTGWTPEEATGQPVQNVFRIINEKTREPADDIVTRVMREGFVVALANHTALISRDGREIPVEDSAAPIKDDNGKVSGVVLVFHDVAERRRAQEALRESEAMLRAVLDQMPSGVTVRDARTGALILSNALSREIMGALADDPGQFARYSGFHPDGRQYQTDEWPVSRSMATGEVVHAEEIECERSDGARVTLSISSAPVRDSEGQIVIGVGIFHDITGRKEMMKNQEILARFPDENPNPVLRISVDATLLYANKGSSPLLESLGWELNRELPAEWKERTRKVLESGSWHQIETVCGDRVYLLAIVPFAESGYLNVYGRDITERRRIETEREITVELLRLINQSEGTAELVHAATTFFQKQSGCEAVGIRLKEGEDFPYFEARGFPEEFIRLENSLCGRDAGGNILRDSVGDPLIECMCGNVICQRTDPSKPFFTEGGSFWANDTTRLLATTSDADRQIRTRNRCNGEGYESVALIPLFVGPERLGLVQLNDRRKGMFSAGTIALWERLAGYLAVAVAKSRAEENVRELNRMLELRVWERTTDLNRANEELRRSNEALNDFASIASHDMKEPLRKVVSFGNLLRQKYNVSLGQTGSDYLNRMIDASQRMQSLLTSLLEYSRVTMSPEPFEEVDLYDIVHGVLSDLEVRIERTGGEVKVGYLPSIEADPAQMRQLFQNLIGNGLKFHKEGDKPLVNVLGSIDKQTVQILVEDNGIGFEQQYLERIFAPFQRLHGRSSRYEGTGMGLAICKKIVERHGGSITARSAPGKGSTFVVTLPATENMQNEAF